MIKPGARAGGYVAVLDGLRAGEKVVTGANFLIEVPNPDILLKTDMYRP